MPELASRSTYASDSRGPSSRRGLFAVIAACGVLALGGATVIGCGGDEESAVAAESTSTTTTAKQSTSVAEESTLEEPADTDAIDISDFKYGPETLAVEAGTEVTWTNSDEAPHTATADESSFDTGTLDRDDEGTVTFDKPGTYSYYCRFHAFMKATVEVD